MDHIAILSKKGKFYNRLLQKIIRGEKTIESRWYVNRVAPWDKIKKDETVYFKESGSPITAKTTVKRVIQYEDLNQKKILEILEKYGRQIGFSPEQYKDWTKQCRNKNYCILIFLQNPKEIKPFNIDKTGYGNSSAWLCTENINNIKVLPNAN